MLVGTMYYAGNLEHQSLQLPHAELVLDAVSHFVHGRDGWTKTRYEGLLCVRLRSH